MAAAPWIVSDELWELVEPLLPRKERRFRYPGRKRLPDRRGAAGDPVRAAHGDRLAASAARARLRLGRRPASGAWTSGSGPVCGSGCTRCCSRELRAAGEIEWSRAVADSSHVQAKKGAPRRARARLIRARTGSKHHLLVDASGIPLAWTVTGGNRNDVTQLIPLARARCRRCAARVGRPRRRPERAHRRPRLRPRQVPARAAPSAGSRPRSPAARPSTAPGSAASAGSSSAPSPGCTTSSACSSATTAAPRSTKPSSPSAAASSASGGSSAHCDSSS